jgi:hypothetical protein
MQQEYLVENNEVTYDVFKEKIWDNIHEIYQQPGDLPTKKADDSPLPTDEV